MHSDQPSTDDGRGMKRYRGFETDFDIWATGTAPRPLVDHDPVFGPCATLDHCVGSATGR